MALMRRTRVFRAVGWLVCWVMEIPGIDDVDQAALDAHIAALAEQDREAARVPDEPAQQRANPPPYCCAGIGRPAPRLITTSTPATSTAGVGASPAVARAGPPRTTGFADNGWTTDGYTAPQPAPPRKRADRPHLPLRDLLAAVASARRTRVELVSQQLDMEASRVRPAWDLALRTHMLEPVAIDPSAGETMYRLSDRGRRALRVLSLGRPPHLEE